MQKTNDEVLSDPYSYIKSPKGWMRTTFANENFFKILKAGINYFEGSKNYLSTSSIQTDKIYHIEEIVTYDSRPSRANMQTIIESVWFARMKNTLKVMVATNDLIENYILSTGFCGIEIKNMDPRYIKWYLMSFWFNMEKDLKSTGATQMAINNHNIKTLRIQFPRKLEYQAKIVKKIETLFSLIENGKEALDSTLVIMQKYRQSILKAAIGGNLTNNWREKHRDTLVSATKLLDEILQNRREKWEEDQKTKMRLVQKHPKNENWKQKLKSPKAPESSLFSQLPENWTKCSIDQISFMIGSGSTPKGGKKNYQESGIRFIRSQNVLDQKLNFTEIAYINETIHKNMYRTHVYFGDVLLNITGASIGRVASYTDDKPANVNQHVCIIRLVRLIPEWITLFLASEFGQDQIMSKQSGMTREGLNYEQLRQITLPLPPIEEQKEILKIYNRCLSTIECVEKVVIKEIENTELLKQSILKSAFEGNLISTNNGEEDENLSKHLDVKKSYDHQTKLDNWT